MTIKAGCHDGLVDGRDTDKRTGPPMSFPTTRSDEQIRVREGSAVSAVLQICNNNADETLILLTTDRPRNSDGLSERDSRG